MPSKDQARRAKFFRALHAEAAKRGIDHDALRDIFRDRYKLKSMSDATPFQLEAVLRSWTGKSIKRTTELPRKGVLNEARPRQFVSGEDLQTLADAFHKRGWGDETRRQFIRRQLHGRDTIRTVQDFHRVFSGVRAMNRREEQQQQKEPQP